MLVYRLKRCLYSLVVSILGDGDGFNRVWSEIMMSDSCGAVESAYCAVEADKSDDIAKAENG